MTTTTHRFLAVLILLGAAHAVAQTGGPPPGETTPPGANKPPEPQAIEACKGKAEGDRVYFTDSKGKKRHYTCTTVNGVFAARSGVATPAHPPKQKSTPAQ